MNVPVPIKENFKTIIFYIRATFTSKNVSNPCSKTLKRCLKYKSKSYFCSSTIKVFILEVLNAF